MQQRKWIRAGLGLLIWPLLVGFGSDGLSPEWEFDSPVTESRDQQVDPQSVKPLPVVKTPTSRTEALIHTVVTIQIFHENQEKTLDQAIDYIKQMEQLLSTHIEGSDVDRINKAAGKEPVAVAQETYDIIKQAVAVAKESDGLFDISIGPLVDLWQIGTPEAHVPKKEAIDDAIAHIDYRQIELNDADRTVFLKKPGMALELGGISKGYIGSGVARLLLEQGVTTAIVNLGGNVCVLGTSPAHEEGWNVGIQDPKMSRGATVGSVRVKNRAVVTSGIYEQYFEQDGKVYHHIMDPKTGYPLDNEISGVTIFAPTSFLGDSYSTALFMMGIDKGLDFINRKEGFEAIFTDKDGGVHLTDGIKADFTLTDKEYHIVEH